MIIKDSGTELFLNQSGFVDGLYIRLEDGENIASIDLNKEQLHELYQYIKACVYDQPQDVLLK